jgi:hypothetical protein
LSGKIRDGAKAGVDAARTGMEEIPVVIGEVTPEATGATQKLGESIRDGLTTGTDGTSDDMRKTLDLVRDAIHGKEGSLKTAGNSIGQAVSDGFGESSATLQQRSVDAVAGVVDGLIGAATGAFGGGVAVGDAAGRGIAAGISATLDLVQNAANNVVADALSGVKKAFHIESPSKVFADEVGLPLAQGIAAGVTQGSPGIQASIEEAIRDAVSKIETARVAISPVVKPKSTTGNAELDAYLASLPTTPGMIQAEDGSWVNPNFYSKRASGAVFNIEKVVLAEETANPVRVTIRGSKQLRRSAAMAGLG